MSNSNEIKNYRDIVEHFDSWLEKRDHYFKHSGPNNLIDTIMREWKLTINNFLIHKVQNHIKLFGLPYHYDLLETKPSPNSGKNVKIFPKK